MVSPYAGGGTTPGIPEPALGAAAVTGPFTADRCVSGYLFLLHLPDGKEAEKRALVHHGLVLHEGTSR
jgi:hypothetical protein